MSIKRRRSEGKRGRGRSGYEGREVRKTIPSYFTRKKVFMGAGRKAEEKKRI